jgi:hypothetical protein
MSFTAPYPNENFHYSFTIFLLFSTRKEEKPLLNKKLQILPILHKLNFDIPHHPTYNTLANAENKSFQLKEC